MGEIIQSLQPEVDTVLPQMFPFMVLVLRGSFIFLTIITSWSGVRMRGRSCFLLFGCTGGGCGCLWTGYLQLLRCIFFTDPPTSTKRFECFSTQWRTILDCHLRCIRCWNGNTWVLGLPFPATFIRHSSGEAVFWKAGRTHSYVISYSWNMRLWTGRW